MCNLLIMKKLDYCCILNLIKSVAISNYETIYRLRLLPLLYDIEVMWQKRINYSDKTWVFDQSERAQGPIYIINSDKIGFFLERAQGLIYIINCNKNLYSTATVPLFKSCRGQFLAVLRVCFVLYLYQTTRKI